MSDIDGNPDCPSNDYKNGEPSGECWGDGHYTCKTCKHYRADFKKHGQYLIDFAHRQQGEIKIKSLPLS